MTAQLISSAAVRVPSSLAGCLLAFLAAGGPAAAGAQHAAPSRRDTTQLDTVRVSSRAGARDGFAVEVIDRRAIDRLPALTIGDVIARSLGGDVQHRSPASADVALRGASYQQVLVLVDGVRMSDLQTGHFSLDLALPLDEVERIEVLRGSASSIYGADAAGGVVSIVTRAGASRSARLTMGSFGTTQGAVTAGASGAQGTVRAGVERATADGHRAGTDYATTLGRIALSRQVGSASLRLDAGVGVRSFGANTFYGPYDSHERTSTTTSSLRLATPVGTRTIVTSTASFRRHDDRFTLRRNDPAFYQNEHRNDALTWEGTARHALSPATAVAFGGEMYVASLESARLGDRREHRGAAFGELSHAAGRIDVTAGARLDRSSNFGAMVSPSLSGRLRMNDGWYTRAAVSRGFRAPSWTERYYQDPANRGEPTLGTERFWNGEAAVGAALPSGGTAELTTFVRRSHDLIDWTRDATAPATTLWVATNVGSSTMHGVELSAVVPRVIGIDWRLRAQGVRFDAVEAEGLVGKYALRPLTRSAGIIASRVLGGGVSLSADLATARRANEASYTTLDARVAWSRSAWRVTFDAANLGAARWLDASGVPSPGRGVRASIERFGR